MTLVVLYYEYNVSHLLYHIYAMLGEFDLITAYFVYASDMT